METNSLNYSNKICEGIKAKAKKNKDLSTFLFLVVLLSTVVSPVLILISNNFYISKLCPAILTAFAALASYWIQLRKPHERWALYRTAQRDIEFEIDQHAFQNGDYAGENADKVLADKVSKRALKLHYDWMPLVPKSKELQKLTKVNNE